MGSGQFTTQVSRNMRSSVVLSSRYLLSRGTNFLICFHDIRFDCLEYTSNNTYQQQALAVPSLLPLLQVETAVLQSVAGARLWSAPPWCLWWRGAGRGAGQTRRCPACSRWTRRAELRCSAPGHKVTSMDTCPCPTSPTLPEGRRPGWTAAA